MRDLPHMRSSHLSNLQPSHLSNLQPSDLQHLQSSHVQYLRDSLQSSHVQYVQNGLWRPYLRHLRHLQPACLYLWQPARMPIAEADSAKPSQPWRPVVSAELAAQALDVAHRVAGRLRDRQTLLQINLRALTQSRYPDTLHWSPGALAHGDAGMALACAHFDRCWPDEDWRSSAAIYLRHALQAARSNQTGAGMFAGLAGVAFAALMQAKPADNADLDRHLAQKALELVGQLHGRHGVAVSEFDLISGLTGTGAYFLAADSPPPADVALRAVLESFVSLSQYRNGIAHWHTPHALLGDNPMAAVMPHGNINCGLAHGVPGALALMALALKAGVEADGLSAATAQTAEWVAGQQTHDACGVNWPTVVPLDAQGQPILALMGSRAAWCYGAPGVARSLWLAGQALGDAALCDLAIDAMTAIYRRPVAARQIDSPTFCHGVAGLLHISLRFAHDTGLALFSDAADALCRQLLADFDQDHVLGYTCLEPEGNRVDQCGLLDGAAGVALVLLAASQPQLPAWDRAFLLS